MPRSTLDFNLSPTPLSNSNFAYGTAECIHFPQNSVCHQPFVSVFSMNGAVMSLSSILGNLLCGVLIAAVGIRMCYVIIGGMTAVFAALFVLFLLIGKKKKIAL